nr:response regulator [Lachnospiraceae bacterium]
VRDILIVLMAICSTGIYWLCFLDANVPEAASVFLFIFYLLPIAFTSIVYGWYGGILCFTPFFVVAVILSPGNAYFLFFHLVAIYVYSYIKDKGLCSGLIRTIITGLVSGLFISAVYYLIFVLIAGESFSEVNAASMLIHLCNIVPQSVLICLFIHWFSSDKRKDFRSRIGYAETSPMSVMREEGTSLKKGYRGLSGKIFAILLIEAVFMGVAAAFFANSLIPKMMERYRQEPAASVIESTQDGTPSEKPSTKPSRKPDSVYGDLSQMVGFNDAFDAAREHAMHDRFAFDDQGIAFDLKLIMLLLCVIHPIVLVANYVGQMLIVKPIVSITGIMDKFDDEEEQRLLVEKELSELTINSEDEIESLYKVIYRMSSELNSYIDDMKREQQLKEDLRVAKASSEAKSTFLSNVSHEIRTPINAVLGMDEMILRESNDKEILKYAADIKNSGKTLLSLINDLLDFSKIEAGKMEIIPVEYELSSTINDLINMVRAKAEDKGLKLNIDVDPSMPHVLFGDEIRIKQCILNILNNAVKYTQKGSVTMTVSYKKLGDNKEGILSENNVRDKEDQAGSDEIALCIRVKDTGIGIKEEDLKKLYSPFERIEEERNRNIEGTGLGMSIVKHLLDMMGSSLSVTSVYGEGSDFSFEVNQKVMDWEPIGDFNETYIKSLESIERYRVSFIAPDAHILVVDDTPINLSVIRSLLKETRVNIDTATSGAECLDKIRTASYDIIFMDQRMPEMDGTETLHAMKTLTRDENRSYDAPVIILTANVVAGAKEQFISEGFNDYLSKPVDALKLEHMIAEYLPSGKVMEPPEETEEGSNESAGGDSSDDSAFMNDYAAIKGIDIDAALKNCLNADILKNTVHDFYAYFETGSGKIKDTWKAGNIKDYTVAVHALKSSSRLIGAMDLSKMAAGFEESGDREDITAINEGTPALLDKYSYYFDSLASLFKEEEDDEAADSREMIDPAALSEAYGAIKEAVDAFDFNTADELVGMLKEYRLPPVEAARYERICGMITRLERDAILEELNNG